MGKGELPGTTPALAAARATATQAALRGLLSSDIDAEGLCPLEIYLAPWTPAWHFELAGLSLGLCKLLRASLERFIQRGQQATLYPLQPFLVSWH